MITAEYVVKNDPSKWQKNADGTASATPKSTAQVLRARLLPDLESVLMSSVLRELPLDATVSIPLPAVRMHGISDGQEHLNGRRYQLTLVISPMETK